jgi:hypothetical protein
VELVYDGGVLIPVLPDLWLKMGLRHQHAAQNLAALRVLYLNLLRRNRRVQRGIRTKQKLAGWDRNHLRSLPSF